MKLHTKYKLKVLISPSVWMRRGKADPTWDKFLWIALELNKIEIIGKYEAIIDGVIVWIENVGFSDGTKDCRVGSKETSLYCNRATALYLQDQLKDALLVQRLKGPFDEMEVWKKYRINL